MIQSLASAEWLPLEQVPPYRPIFSDEALQKVIWHPNPPPQSKSPPIPRRFTQVGWVGGLGVVDPFPQVLKKKPVSSVSRNGRVRQQTTKGRAEAIPAAGDRDRRPWAGVYQRILAPPGASAKAVPASTQGRVGVAKRCKDSPVAERAVIGKHKGFPDHRAHAMSPGFSLSFLCPPQPNGGNEDGGRLCRGCPWSTTVNGREAACQVCLPCKALQL